MAQGTIIANGLSYLPHVTMWDDMIKDRFSQLDLDVLLIYYIDTVDASALPYLAKQFDVLGYAGYRLAQTDDEKRALIKQAIMLHRYRGTLWAIKQAIEAIGFGDAVIEEHVYNHWANFRVVINVLDRNVTDADVANLRNLVLYWKNARSNLYEIAIDIDLSDSITIDDVAGLNQYDTESDSVRVGGNFLLNGTIVLDGSHNLSNDSDTLILNLRDDE